MGGTWAKQDKVRPGVYINFKGKQILTIDIGDRGTVALPIELNWGESEKVFEVDKNTDFVSTLGYEYGSKELLLVNEALKRANKLMLYRTNGGGTKASATIEEMTIAAKYEGIRGNDIQVSVVKNGTTYTITTYLAGIVQDVQTIADLLDYKDNFVSITGTIEETAGIELEGGTNAAAGNDYQTALDALKTYDWNTIALCGGVATIKSSFVSYIKNLREEEGKYVVGVMSEYPGADYEGIINVKNGVVLQDGTELTPAQACAWVAGATAAAAVNESLTYDTYDGAIGTTLYLNSEIINSLNAGEFIFVESSGTIKVEQDINSLTTFTDEKPNYFRKNRVLRVMDAIGNDLKGVFKETFIGKINNNADGRNLFKAEIISYLNELQRINAIQNFTAEDVEVLEGSTGDSIVINLSVETVDSIEKIYTTITVE